MTDLLCDHCSGLCCRYFALPIDEPTTAGEFDDVRWFMLHKGISVFVEDGQWYINIASPCRHLGPDHRCTIYEKRPRICRAYNTDNCDYHDGRYEYEHHFTTVESLEAFGRDYLRQKYRKSGPNNKHRPRPGRLRKP